MTKTTKIDWDKDFKFEDFKVGDVYIIDNYPAIKKNPNKTSYCVVTRCTTINSRALFDDISVLRGGPDSLISGWAVYESDFWDNTGKNYLVKKLNPEEYPEYYI